MPTYPYQCPKCRSEAETVCSVTERPKTVACPCGGRMERKYVPIIVGGFIPRTLSLKGDSVRVESKEQLKRECDQRGLIHRGYHYHEKGDAL